MSRCSTGDLLAAALSERLGDLRDLTHEWTDWCSAGFAGARHEMRFVVDGDAAPALETIAEDDLTMRQGFVADLVVVAQSRRADGVAVTLEALTLSD